MRFSSLVKRLRVATYALIHAHPVDKSHPFARMSDAISVANHVLSRARANNRPLTPLQLMKLVYISQGWMLGLHHRRLFPERVEAWQYGPVVPALYSLTKQYGSKAIDGDIANGRAVALAPDEAAVVDSVVDQYAHLSGMALSNLTHRGGSPWSQVWRPGSYHLEIRPSDIEHHYTTLAQTGVVTSA